MSTQTERKATIVGPYAGQVKATRREAPSSSSAADVERVNDVVATEIAENELRAVVGTGEVLALRAAREDAQRVAAAQAADAARVAASGGLEVTTELRGKVGREVADVLRLDDIAAAARKLLHRVETERVEQLAQLGHAASMAKLDGLLAAGWEDAAAKRAVPGILAPWSHWQQHERPRDTNPDFLAGTAVERIKAQHAQRKAERVAERVEDADAVLVAAAVGVLESAGRAADVLAGVGLTPDATAEQIVDSGSSDAGTAWKQWREAVGVWSDVQSARRWLSAAVALGFDAKKPDQLAGAGVSQIEADVWRTQWVGVSMDYVEGSSAALVWWLGNGRPAPAGINGKAGVR